MISTNAYLFHYTGFSFAKRCVSSKFIFNEFHFDLDSSFCLFPRPWSISCLWFSCISQFRITVTVRIETCISTRSLQGRWFYHKRALCPVKSSRAFVDELYGVHPSCRDTFWLQWKPSATDVCTIWQLDWHTGLPKGSVVTPINTTQTIGPLKPNSSLWMEFLTRHLTDK